ncbi:hypothetical protein [Rhizobium sp. 007]|uniref:hypothetical protein n=1 Tax=Rhizobium sp. 007 TaxID=2785056 RepID=UPI00188E6A3D|nr:hypothetical protein [Rhizobium sp. 007]QPB21023.1 hypothetical protein ISN39_05945 [Rhizobium sp. 007]
MARNRMRFFDERKRHLASLDAALACGMATSKPAAFNRQDVFAELKDRIIVSWKVHIAHVSNSAMNYEAIVISQARIG